MSVVLMVDILKLLEYNQNVRHSYLECFTKLPWKEFIKNREASFHSIRNILVHSLEAIDYWLDFLQGQKLRSGKQFSEYKTFKEVKAYMKHVEKRMSKYCDSLPAGELGKKYTAKGEDGKPFEITAEDVLIHVFEEEVHHRGEFIALLWQIGVEPPPMGWKGL